MNFYHVEIDGQRVHGIAADVLKHMQNRAMFFDGTAAEYIDWLAANIRRTRHIFIDTAPGQPLETRQETTVAELIRHGLIKPITAKGYGEHAKAKKTEAAHTQEGPERPD